MSTQGLITTLTNAVNARRKKWAVMRGRIALSAMQNFSFLLEHRGYTGSLSFNHDHGKLTVTVRTNEDAMKEATGKKGRNKDPKSLSGGEKSFSTICLLLSLWAAMGSPIRALDEFDVFMDSVNRTLSMEIMVTAARDEVKCQYILISPQSMMNVAMGPDVHVVKMYDPDRKWANGQTTLDAHVIR